MFVRTALLFPRTLDKLDKIGVGAQTERLRIYILEGNEGRHRFAVPRDNDDSLAYLPSIFGQRFGGIFDFEGLHSWNAFHLFRVVV
jgi:hypothetical protein